MPFEHWLSLFAICLLGAMSPGPSLAVITGITLRAGAGPGYGAALAHGVGVGCYGLLTIAGLAVLIDQLAGHRRDGQRHIHHGFRTLGGRDDYLFQYLPHGDRGQG